MSWKTKHRIVALLIALLTAWPLVHHALVGALDLNPWKWFGWSMYTTVPRRIQVQPISLDDGSELNPAKTSKAHVRAINEAYLPWSLRYLELGRLAPPDEFARVLFRAFPDVNGIEIQIRRVVLDRSTAMIELGEPVEPPFRYTRDELLE